MMQARWVWVGRLEGLAAAVAIALVLTGLWLSVPPLEAQNTWLTMHAAATTGNGALLERRAAETFTVCAVWAANTDAGVLTIEEVALSPYTGTWSSLATLNFLDDGQECIHLAQAPYGAIRARISTTVTTGTVTVYGRGNR